MGEFLMPSLGADMERGTIVQWRVHPGDHVQRGDIVAVVDTEKSTIEVETFESGVIEEILVPEGTEVAVGTPLARITATREPVGAVVGDGTRASPRARRRAAQLGVDLALVTGTGPGGAVTAEDVEEARGGTSSTPRPTPSPLPEEPRLEERPAPVEPAPVPPPAQPGSPDRQAAMRHAIAELMARSKREIPHYYVSLDVDMTAATTWLAEANRTRPTAERLLPAALLIKAVAMAAADTPAMNGFWVDGGFQAGAGVHVGVAVALRGGGVIAPAIHDTDSLSLEALMTALRDVVGRARSGVLRGSEMSDPTITVTNLGEQGVDTVTGVIYPPQVALVGFGRIHERPWAADGMVGARPVVTVTLAADHRASDGHAGARFLAAIDHLLQRPEEL